MTSPRSFVVPLAVADMALLRRSLHHQSFARFRDRDAELIEHALFKFGHQPLRTNDAEACELKVELSAEACVRLAQLADATGKEPARLLAACLSELLEHQLSVDSALAQALGRTEPRLRQ